MAIQNETGTETEPQPKDSAVKGEVVTYPGQMQLNPERSKQPSREELRESFIGTMVETGAAWSDESIFLRGFNSLHRIDYFNPHVTGNLHIFMTRPQCTFNPANLRMDPFFFQACMTQEGRLLLASLMEPSGVVCRNEWTNYVKGAKGVPLHPYSTPWGKDEFAEAAYDALMSKGHGSSGIGATPFIPLVSNLSTGINGFKDLIMEKYDYDGDQAGNKTSEPMGLDDSLSSGEFTINFHESSNLDVTVLHMLWMKYSDNIGKGLMTPSKYSMDELIYEDQASLYWFVTGVDGFSIKLYGKLTGIFPVSVPVGSLVPGERGQLTDAKTSITYHYQHSEFMNPDIIGDFSYIVEWQRYHLSGKQKLAVDATPGSPTIKAWLDYAAGTDRVSKLGEGGVKYGTYNKYYKTARRINKTAETKNSEDFSYAFVQSPANQWSGHPFIEDGKLIYKALAGPSTGATQAGPYFDFQM
jgi:hypothetical protein